jgi:hypothetical protein
MTINSTLLELGLMSEPARRIHGLLLLTVVSCGDSSPGSVDLDGLDGTTTAAADAGYGDPAAPGQDCPESFDPDAVYVILERAGFERDILLFANVEAPGLECAFSIPGAGDELEYANFAVRDGDGQMLRIRYDDPANERVNDLYGANPDALERRQPGGPWSAWTAAGGNDDGLFQNFAGDECSWVEPPAFMTYGPTGELGYRCRDAPGLWSFDGRVISNTSVRYPLAFLDDGRVLAAPEPGGGGLSIVNASGEGDPIPLEYEGGGNFLIGAVQRVEGSLRFVAEVSEGEPPGAAARLRLDGEVLVLEQTFLPFDLASPRYGMDRTGRVTVLGTHRDSGTVQVLRLDPGGNRIVYETPDLDGRSAWSMPESSGAMNIHRLVAPP